MMVVTHTLLSTLYHLNTLSRHNKVMGATCEMGSLDSEIISLELTSDGIALNTALIRSLQDLKVSAITPGSGPRVLNEPVVLTVLGTVTDNLDSMATEDTTRGVLVDTRLVSREISVDGESSFDRAVGRDFLHHVLDRRER